MAHKDKAIQRILDRKGPRQFKLLLNDIQTTPRTLSKHLKRLKQDGYVEKRTRKSPYEITPIGRVYYGGSENDDELTMFLKRIFGEIRPYIDIKTAKKIKRLVDALADRVDHELALKLGLMGRNRRDMFSRDQDPGDSLLAELPRRGAQYLEVVDCWLDPPSWYEETLQNIRDGHKVKFGAGISGLVFKFGVNMTSLTELQKASLRNYVLERAASLKLTIPQMLELAQRVATDPNARPPLMRWQPLKEILSKEWLLYNSATRRRTPNQAEQGPI